MSKKRSITKKISLQELEFPSPDENDAATDNYIQETYFGEKVQNDVLDLEDTSESSTKSSATFDVIYDDDFYDIDSLGFSKSSASSTSGDDLENEATKRVAQEFSNFENAIYCEKISKICPENESIQWKDQFPHMRIVGSVINTSSAHGENTDEYYEEVLAEHHSDTDTGCDHHIQNTDHIKSKIKETVINNVLKQIKSKLSTIADSSSSSTSTLQLTSKTPKITVSSESIKQSANNEQYLEISSMPLNKSPMRYPKFEYQSPVMRSHLSASKWQRDNSCSEYSSLPHITNLYVPYQSQFSRQVAPLSANRNEQLMNRYSAKTRQKSGPSIPRTNTKYTSTPVISPRGKNVILPPIQNLNMTMEGDPIMATPRKCQHKK